ncbi:MAG: hypothetical protein GY769_08810 [bacterium]|nr:hypothetical protein [bacterium]
MTAENGADQRLTGVSGAEKPAPPRRTRRAAIHGLLVAIDVPELSSQPWVVDGIDLNSKGMGLVLPPELLAGTRVLLSFKLGEHELSRLPATVQHKVGVSGGVRFETWPDSERLKLLEFLAGVYERLE